MMMYCLLLLLLVACHVPANSQSTDAIRKTADFTLPYQLDEPSNEFKLSGKLEEISGLGIHLDPRYLVAVQDEDGEIFIIDRATGKTEQRISFWKDGDYEGVETAGELIFAVKSTGTLYCIHRAGRETQQVDKYNTFLNDQNDVEGLAYDAARNRLLLACKAKAGDGDAYRLKKAIYSFDLERMELDSLPAYVISLEEVHAYLGTDPAIRKLEKLWEFFTPDESEFGFSPSGLAIHPLTGDLYITSSVGKLLMVLSPEGKIRHIEKLKKSIHPQPEGICFDTEGCLYIANEGKGGNARLYQFSMRKN